MNTVPGRVLEEELTKDSWSAVSGDRKSPGSSKESLVCSGKSEVHLLTGHGKSMIFQLLPNVCNGLALRGDPYPHHAIILVVFPLIKSLASLINWKIMTLRRHKSQCVSKLCWPFDQRMSQAVILSGDVYCLQLACKTRCFLYHRPHCLKDPSYFMTVVGFFDHRGATASCTIVLTLILQLSPT